MVELADAMDSKSIGSDTISVRPRSAAPQFAYPRTNSVRGYFFRVFALSLCTRLGKKVSLKCLDANFLAE